MGMTRQERVASHKKQDRLQVGTGRPAVSDLIEGVPVLRKVPEGLVQYTRYNNALYEQPYRRVGSSKSSGKKISASLSITPDYDSGWVTVTNGNNTTHYDFTHNLHTKILLTQCYLKDTTNSDRIFNVSTQFVDTIYSGDDISLSFYHETVDNIAVCTGNDYIFCYDNTPYSATGVRLASADIRILAWKLNTRIHDAREIE